MVEHRSTCTISEAPRTMPLIAPVCMSTILPPPPDATDKFLFCRTTHIPTLPLSVVIDGGDMERLSSAWNPPILARMLHDPRSSPSLGGLSNVTPFIPGVTTLSSAPSAAVPNSRVRMGLANYECPVILRARSATKPVLYIKEVDFTPSAAHTA